MSQSQLQRGGSPDPLPSSAADQVRAAYASGERGFSWQNLAGVDLHGTNLQDCNFYGCDFTAADLSGVDLSRANLSHAKLTSANLRGANLSGAFLDQTDLTGADTTGLVTDQPSSPPPSPNAQLEPQPVAQSLLPQRDTHFCVYCGTALPTDAAFCRTCGKAQPQNSSVAANQIEGTSIAATPVSMFAPPSAPEQLGRLIGDYPGSIFRFTWVVFGGLTAAYGLVASLMQESFIGIVFWLVVGGVCYAYYNNSARHEVRAQIFEHGFVISSGGKTTTARWESVLSVTHSVTRWRIYWIIPIAYSHSYIISLMNGEQVRVSLSFQRHRQLGDTIEQMWRKSTIAMRLRAGR